MPHDYDQTLPAADPAAPRARRGPAQDTLHALAKDVQAVTARAQALKDQAVRVQQTARATRARPPNPFSPPLPDLRVTIPEACQTLGICERTLRVALRAPHLAAQIQSGTRKAGTFYKTVRLLPPSLVAELMPRFAKPSDGKNTLSKKKKADADPA